MTDDEFAGKTIKDLLVGHYKMSGSMIKALKREEDGILVNGEPKFVVHILEKGDDVQLTMREAASDNIALVKADFGIVYEDEDIIIVNKPANMPTHPSQGNHENTLANALMYYFKENNCECAFHAVNRLDKDTSGLMAVAKNSYTHARLCDDIRSKAVKRKYHAIVCGEMHGEGTVDAPIKRAEESCIKRCVAEDGQRAITHYKTIKSGKYSLLELELETGRTHQIRVHMAHISHPLLGDWLYGCEDKELFKRQALHSCYISLKHPLSGKVLEFYDYMAQDMAEFLEKVNKI